MDGHECTEILFSQLERTNRLDSEFYKKKSLQIVSLLQGMKATPLTTCVDVSDGNHMGISDKFIEEGIPYYRGQDIHNFFIEDAHPICIDEETYNGSYMHRSHLKKNDILLSIVGTIGEVALVSKDEKATCSCKLAILRPHDEKRAALLAIYLRSKYGFDQVDKFKRGAVQMGYLLEDMNQILIPDFSSKMDEIIAKAIDGIKLLMDRSNQQYASAEKCLLDEIGIDMASISSGGVSVKSFADSFGSSGRLDAEYYQNGHYELMTKVGTAGTIGSKCKIYDKTYNPISNKEYQYIELANIGKSGEIENVELILGSELPSRARRIVKQGQIVVSSIEGSLDSCAMITDKYNGALCSTGFYVIDSDSYNSETLLVLIKSRPIQRLLKRGCSGTILTNITKDEFLNVPLPEVSAPIQVVIKEKVKETYELGTMANTLLECAKTAVEMAIEKDEASAIDWLENKILELTSEVAYEQ